MTQPRHLRSWIRKYGLRSMADRKAANPRPPVRRLTQPTPLSHVTAVNLKSMYNVKSRLTVIRLECSGYKRMDLS